MAMAVAADWVAAARSPRRARGAAVGAAGWAVAAEVARVAARVAVEWVEAD